jgi:DNA invertase Pin-like site-specific DNA recombinase
MKSKRKAIAYFRVSTDRQGKSRLGLDAQKEAVQGFLRANDWQLIDQYTEVESGKLNDRPELQNAIEACRKQKAVLVIAKLDRLGRNLAFIANLMEAKADFVAVDNPHANKLMIHMLAAFAEHEREMISERTKSALSAAKARGVQLGKHGREVLSKQNREQAQAFAQSLRPIIEDMQRRGITTLRAIQGELNSRNIRTANNNQWHPQTVQRLLKRLEQQS